MNLDILAKAGITVDELGKAGNKINKIMYEITLEGIKQLAKDRSISIEEAEVLYFRGIRAQELNVNGKEL